MLKSQPRLMYRVTHPLYGSNVVFDHYAELCEKTMDIAIRKAEELLLPAVQELASYLADEMIETAEEYESKATD